VSGEINPRTYQRLAQSCSPDRQQSLARNAPNRSGLRDALAQPGTALSPRERTLQRILNTHVSIFDLNPARLGDPTAASLINPRPVLQLESAHQVFESRSRNEVCFSGDGLRTGVNQGYQAILLEPPSPDETKLAKPDLVDFALSPHGDQLLGLQRGGGLRRTELDTQATQERAPVLTDARKLAWEPQSDLIAVANRATVKVLRGIDDADPLELPAADQGDLTTLTFLPGERLLVASEGSAPAKLWDLANPNAPLLEMPTNYLRHAAASTDGKRIAVVDTAGKIQVWDVDQRQVIAKLNTSTDPWTSMDRVTFLNKDQLLASSQSGTLQRWNIHQPEAPQEIRNGFGGRVVAVSPKHDLLWTVGQTTQLWSFQPISAS
jgi:WD40 repeat protein